MKSFYEMLKLIENEIIRTPGGYVLTPEEVEDYEREKSPMYKALMLKDIDAKRRTEEERSPERIAAREAERKRQEDEKETRTKELREIDPNYILKALGILVNAIEKTEGDCKLALMAPMPNLKKDGNNWAYKTKYINFEDIPVFDGRLGIPETDKDIAFIKDLQQGLVFAMEDSEEYGGCEIILDTLIRLGCKPYLKVGDIVDFDGRHHATKDPVGIYEKVRVAEPGLVNSLNHLLIKAKVVKL